mmetsp:Transcript_27040/g.37742  ORF Transcript_27040/g.37742 Transcript_27040/m.37742 type:complete len:394 (+) Transcript_27040:142-1323(+)|eukprot:CAMPEP_0185251096 /NCGR_PEP_ID=MMETSP1359-20130426/441_1 /TAXON_ID=552665 /ORGANISM="Bigelowiella longifila, Strain CCMP242" /LENGTH=393 /DNA_ID=CAMNT_0027832831 /DNA_START=93 /DNA_END=1274 /DNA_ORIENTATION=-
MSTGIIQSLFGLVVIALCVLEITDYAQIDTKRFDIVVDTGNDKHERYIEEIMDSLHEKWHHIHRKEALCDSFPHLRETMGQKLNEKYRLLVSTLVFEPIWYLEQYYDNVLQYTGNDTLIVAHLSIRTNYTEGEIKRLVEHHPRLVVNCHRYFTHAYHGSLAHAHIRNIEWVAGLQIKFESFMMLASNSWLVKPGVEDYIAKHGASMRLQPMAKQTGLRGAAHVPISSIPQKIVGGWNVDGVLSRIWNWKPMKDVVAPAFKDIRIPNRLTTMKHEGAFFPGSLMVDLVESLKNYPGSFDTMLKARVYLEESLFSTWVDHQGSHGNGLNVIHIFTQSSGRDYVNNAFIRAVAPKQVDFVRTKTDAYGIKSVSRDAVDHHGTRAYIHKTYQVSRKV